MIGNILFAYLLSKTHRNNECVNETKERKPIENGKEFYPIDKIPPFHIGDVITCMDNEILITGFSRSSNGEVCITGRLAR